MNALPVQDGRPLPSNSNPGKRVRSPGVVDERGQPRDAGKEGKRRREGVGEDKRGQRTGRRQARRVRWKDDADLVTVRLIYKTTEEGAIHADLSHEEEGKMLRRKPVPLLEWYCPKPLAIPPEYIAIPAVSSIGASAPSTTLEFDEDVLDVAMEESPSDKVEESGQVDRTGLLAETAAIPWPDILTSEAGVDAYFPAWDDTQENSRAGILDEQHTNRRASPSSQANDFHSERSHTALAGHHTPVLSAAVPLPAPRGIRDGDAQRDSHMRKGQSTSVCHHYRKAGGCLLGAKCKFLHI